MEEAEVGLQSLRGVGQVEQQEKTGEAEQGGGQDQEERGKEREIEIN